MPADTLDLLNLVPEPPLRDLTETEIKAFELDGAVLVRGVIPSSWVSHVADAIDHMTSHLTPYGEFLSSSAHRMYTDLFMWQYDDAFRDFVFRSPAARIAAQALRSDRINFLVDQMFKKDIGCKVPTQWHTDDIAWPVRGSKLMNIWFACDEATTENSSLQFVRGSHQLTTRRTQPRHDTRTDERLAKALAELGWKPTVVEPLELDEPVTTPALMRAAFQWVHQRFEQEMIDAPLPAELHGLISIEPNRDALPIISWDVEPGDAIIFHPGILHYSTGNEKGASARRALTTRWLGSDTTYFPSPGNTPLLWDHGLRPGDGFGGPLFPQILPGVIESEVSARFLGPRPGNPEVGYRDLRFRVDLDRHGI
ncbi:phytanoyl-CoA dioxygenase family protein [Nonomuraea sp. K274]|uniref:Phytanoyl-CoA dioxygenase family protein n=1 Tax=Nonomuraea cypriaca TaxID=1187855 RepID=A0A931EWT1_9ACTN|nr:phytanoyl-CoA dioxygenase family protein [Nonomuraea cypriaca]MBF8184777.1 phytanoyl-CoA dioxygenase family protein [Nonomuraea cypriaca]